LTERSTRPGICCPLCGSTVFRDWRFGLFECADCRLVVAAAVWEPGANEQLNAIFFDDDRERPSIWVRIFEGMNNRRTLRRLRRVRGGERGDLLEVGVGSGSLLSDARARGYRTIGCDLSPTISTQVERSTGIRVHCGSLGSLVVDGKFDVVVMNHVLEHVQDPVALLEGARSRLKRGGVVHLSVPNAGGWGARLPGWTAYECLHLLYFTPNTLRIAAEKAGLKVRLLKTHESFSGWFLAFIKLVLGKSYLRNARRSGRGRPNSALTHAYRVAMISVGILTYPVRLVQACLGKGDEIILIGGNADHG
jgi:2-polyprenyl-3-methyl-5-hydroxy-6-metoxy-1,4-benzoquinol methylase